MLIELIQILKKEDPQHALMLSGINEAADWIQSLKCIQLNLLTLELQQERYLLDESMVLKLLLLAKKSKHQALYPFVLSLLDDRNLTEEVDYYANLAQQVYERKIGDSRIFSEDRGQPYLFD